MNYGLNPRLECTKEKLEKLYSYYLENLKACRFNFVWLHPSEIITPEMDDDCWCVLDDKYLRSTSDNHDALGLDVLKNGTYWVVSVTKIDGKYHMRDGAHRIDSIKSLMNKGIWPKDKRILCIVKNECINKDLPFYIPLVVNMDIMIRYKKYYESIYDNYIQLEYADQEREIAVMHLKQDPGYLVPMIYAVALRNPFFEYKERTGEIIKPSPIINDEKAWNEFIST